VLYIEVVVQCMVPLLLMHEICIVIFVIHFVLFIVLMYGFTSRARWSPVRWVKRVRLVAHKGLRCCIIRL
jgi:hypothetical protein